MRLVRRGHARPGDEGGARTGQHVALATDATRTTAAADDHGMRAVRDDVDLALAADRHAAEAEQRNTHERKQHEDENQGAESASGGAHACQMTCSVRACQRGRVNDERMVDRDLRAVLDWEKEKGTENRERGG